MPRIEDYKNALKIAQQELIKKNPKRIADMGKAVFHGEKAEDISIELLFLNRKITITWPELKAYHEKKELPIEEQILILHYLKGCLNKPEITGDWISYQDLPDGRFYMDSFSKRTKIPMLNTFGKKPELLVRLAKELYNATDFDYGDFSVKLYAFPYVPVVLIIWRGDEEFPPDGNILFDRGISRIFSAEDIVWLSGMIIYPLIKKAKEL